MNVGPVSILLTKTPNVMIAMYATGSTIVSISNTIFNGLNTLLFTASASLPAQFQPYQWYVGGALYVSGILLETVSEVQRKRFKDKPESKGKAYSGGVYHRQDHLVRDKYADMLKVSFRWHGILTMVDSTSPVPPTSRESHAILTFLSHQTFSPC